LFRVQVLRVALGFCLPILGEFIAVKRCRFHLHDDTPLVTKMICSLASMFFLNALHGTASHSTPVIMQEILIEQK
jgi:hypothetical protein